ncbi:ImmA/IrrE family metallo-endopeptidase [Bifidobacterium pseudolongum]|uniref:ImmA/IrrE family metallo-endopeptidase n=1 Tax=Bifidobacterium pseudolongum TaxID=1694 RepID=UPI001F5D828A|nr:ImmA/IrrE family metallo-endopeptidase [Bifidobacterium pseudolongum]
MAERPLPSGYEGLYAAGLDLIVLDSRLTDVQRRCVLAHEISHARHHDAGCRCDRWTEQRADMEAAAMLISPMEFAYAEAVYEGNTVGMARELNVLPWVVQAYRERLHDDPTLAML